MGWKIGDRFQLIEDDEELERLCRFHGIGYEGGFANGWTGVIREIHNGVAQVNYDHKNDEISDSVPIEAMVQFVVTYAKSMDI